MPYRLSDVQAAKAKIAAACPDVILESWQDYGFKLVGYKKEWWTRPPEKPQVVYQPARHENGQPEIIADIDALIKEWSA